MKGANVLFSQDHDHSKGALGKVYLVDFGLVSKYKNLGLHKAFEPDQRSAHEGTLEYTSRDAHLGCKLSISIFCLIIQKIKTFTDPKTSVLT